MFPAFSAKVVPFLHLTTRIEGRKYDGLLKEKGFRGFPSLAFMDAEGEVVATPPDRSVLAFELCLSALTRFDDVKARADAGDGEAVAELLIIEHDLGRVKSEAFGERVVAALAVAGDAQRKRLEQIRVDNEVFDLVGVSMGPDGMEKAAKGFLKILDSGRRPSPMGKYAGNMWSMLARWAEQKGNASVIRRCAAGMREDFPSDKRMTSYADRLLKTATGLDERDALVVRKKAGESGLEAQILLLEYELRAVTADDFAARAKAALAVATPVEKTKIEQAAIDIVVDEAWRNSWQPGGLDAAGVRLLQCLVVKSQVPSDRLLTNGWQTLARWAESQSDADTVAKVAAGLRKTFEGNERMIQTAVRLDERVKALRKD